MSELNLDQLDEDATPTPPARTVGESARAFLAQMEHLLPRMAGLTLAELPDDKIVSLWRAVNFHGYTLQLRTSFGTDGTVSGQVFALSPDREPTLLYARGITLPEAGHAQP